MPVWKGQLMNFKQVIKTILFLGIFGVILYFLCDIFEQPNNYMAKGYETYKNFEEDTIDAVFIGTSGVNRDWISVGGYDMYGYTVATLSTDALPCWQTLDMIKEAFRFQNPKLVILDMRMFTKSDPSNYPELSKTRSRRAIDVMDFFSPNRIHAIKRTLDVLSEFDENTTKWDPSLFFSFIQYHNRWSDDDFDLLEEIGSEEATYLGFYLSTTNSIKAVKQDKPKWRKSSSPLPDVALESLNEIVEYCNEKGVELLFVDTPHILRVGDSKRNNELCRILDERGLKYINYSTKEWFLTASERGNEYLEATKFDRKNHFYDRSHLNFDGAVVFTRVFAKYLSENYDLADHRGDSRCSEWEGKYEELKQKIERWREKAEDDLLEDETD